MRLSELSDLADKCLEQISQGESEQLQKLLAACMPFFLSFRKRYGFSFIPAHEVRDRLASEAISMAFIRHKENDRPFSFYLLNAFRDCCRTWVRTRESKRIVEMAERLGLEPASIVGQSSPPLPPDVQARRSEFMEQVRQVLQDHPPFSKKLVFEKARGSTFPEMADLNGVSVNECKRVHQHDIYHLRKNISQDHSDETPE